ncbi:hypothetical protein JYK00_00230 [Thermosipho ferrireducens]|uniref:Tail specific protease domain-containing protein n=1 Tax=Thermosipho ferrireducens TaxID=2571116 RepID=A0ABX7S629_9BACT|nr:S41 family peptidase [Thermosipho ferrireducens]QTA38014.1 hypothetical protein JYK00_00230 [Thermosipho ferrireducens]
MKKKIIILFLMFLSVLTISQELFQPEELQKDFDVFINYILKAGIDPFKFVSEETFYSKVDEIKTKLNKPMTKGEFFKTIAPMIHLFSDVHYGIVFNITTDTLVMPFEPVVVGNRLFVKNSLVKELENKAEILKIEGKDVKEIINELKQYLPKVRSDVIHAQVSFLFSYFPEIEDKNTFELLLKINGTKKSVEINAIKYGEKLKQTKQLYPDEWEKRKFSFERKGSIGILKIRTFSYSYRSSGYYKEFLEKTFKENKDMSDLIIDLRGNSGGPLYNVWELFKYLTFHPLKVHLVGYNCKNIPLTDGRIKRTLEKYELNPKIIPAKDNFKGKIWLLINNRIASGAVITTYLFKKFSFGKIIGEKTTEPVNSLGASLGKYILPNTKILVSISGGYYWIEDNPEIEIDYGKNLTEEEKIDYLLGEGDVMLDYAFEIISKN